VQFMKLKLIATIFLILTSFYSLRAQSGMDDFFRSTGKIYTVLAVMVILFGVFIFFLIRLEIKLNKLEKQIKNER